MIPRLVLLLVLATGWLWPSDARAQGDERPEPMVVDSTSGRASVDVSRYLEDDGLRRALYSGLPIRIQVRVELWRDGFLDSEEGSEIWRASVVHDPVSRSYDVTAGTTAAVSLSSLDDVALHLQQNFGIDLSPQREGRFYYLAQVDLESLSLSDLEELGRWLQGDVGAAVSGERAPETAITRGLRRLMVRALGLPARRERLRTGTFSWTPPPAPEPVGAPG